MDGWTGNILRVDLSSGEYAVEELDPETAEKFVGCQGIASKMLFDEIDPTIDPLSDDNKLIFSAGPITGTGGACGSRAMWVAKSPLTGTIGFANTGGYWPAEVRYAGYDMIIFEGKAPSPVYLWIEDDEVELRDADYLWGKEVEETERLIREEIENLWTAQEIRIACIGPAGEQRALIAGIMNDQNRAAGRGGLGAVMGSKNLKAIATRGTKSVTIANPKIFREAIAKALEGIRTTPITGESWPIAGSASSVELYNEAGLVPYRNFQQMAVDGGMTKVTGYALSEKYLVRKRSCFACPMACGGPCIVNEGRYAGRSDRPEYETHALMTAQLGVLNDPAFLLKTNSLCNSLGLDTISAAGTIATAMELFERGHIPESDIGYPLIFGNADAVIDCLKKMATREGFGDLLAQGGHRLAENYSHTEYFMGTKKMEFPAYEVRSAHGMALNLATSVRGACHNRGYTIAFEVLGSPEKVDAITEDGKAQLVFALQNLHAGVPDAGGICEFSFAGQPPPVMAAQIAAATGIDYTLEDLEKCGERIWNLQHLFNRKAGFTRADDTIPRRFLEEPAPAGPGKGTVVNLERMLKEYYEIRGWDEEGNPRPEKLQELGLEDYA